MPKKATTTKGKSRATKRETAAKCVTFGGKVDPSADAALHERRVAAARTAAFIAERDARFLELNADGGSGAVRAELSPLRDALIAVLCWCNALAHSLDKLRSLPKSVARGDWSRQWATEYASWWDAIETAQSLVGSPDVAAIMDAGERRPAKKWTSQAFAELEKLAATLHPSREGGSGLGFIRAGAESLPADFMPRAKAIAARAVKLQSVARSELAAPERDDEADSQHEGDALPPALGQSDCIVLHALKQLGQDRLYSAEHIAAWLHKSHRSQARTPRCISTSVAKLVKVGYAERPNGVRSGARLTMKGLRSGIPDPFPKTS